MIDFSDIDLIRATVEDCNRLPVHVRHPYGGDLVYTAFSGTHQDAISKGLAHHERLAAEQGAAPRQAPWTVPYLPIDPADVGRTYEAVIRVNSQSGKGGIAYLLKQHHGVDLPPDMRADFSRFVQAATDGSGQETTPGGLWELFRHTYLVQGEDGPVRLASWSATETAPGVHRFACRLDNGEHGYTCQGTGDGPLKAFTDALSTAELTVEILDHLTHAAPNGQTIAYARCRIGGTTHWGAGQDASALTASVRAVLSAVNRSR